MRVFLAAVLTGACGLFAQPALATVQPPPGVHIDPGSPTGKQYQIPITGARGETSGNSHKSSSGTAPAFGQGITSSSGGSSSSGSGGSSSSGSASSSPSNAATASRSRHATTSGPTSHSTRKHRGARHTATGRAPTPVSAANAANRSATTQANQVGSSSWLPLAGGGALVLLIGCGGGLALKRRT